MSQKGKNIKNIVIAHTPEEGQSKSSLAHPQSNAPPTESPTARANRLYQTAKAQLELSGNLRTSIKESVLDSLSGLYGTVLQVDDRLRDLELQMERMRAEREKEQRVMIEGKNRFIEEKMGEIMTNTETIKRMINQDIMDRFDEYPPGRALCGNIKKIENLMADIQDIKTTTRQTSQTTENVSRTTEDFCKRMEGIEIKVDAVGTQVGEVKAGVVKYGETARDTGKAIEALKAPVATYAETVRASTTKAQLPPCRPNHALIVSSCEAKDTSEIVVDKVRGILEARKTGAQIERVRKVRDGKVVICCGNRAELERLSDKLKTRTDLRTEPAANRDPRVVMKNMFGYNTEADIVESLRVQNRKLWQNMDPSHFRVKEVYRRRARNPHQAHVVLEVSPQMWRRLIEAETVYIDIQGLTAEDQSPLVQCTRCLGFGHGRKFCKEAEDLCGHCGGAHNREACPSRMAGESPVCRNCDRAGLQVTGHTAFSGECPIRRKWEAIARSTISYC